MQMLALALYKGLERRDLVFKPGKLNVLTGWSQTGKSSVLHIIDYCLGRTDTNIPRGALDVVEWFGLLVEHRGARLFIARPAIAKGVLSGERAMLLQGAKDLPQSNELVVNADAATVRSAISSLLGFEDNVAPDTVDDQQPLEVSVAQAALLCFQSQNEIANPEQLFHRTGDQQRARHLRASMPYLLGAVSGSHARQMARLQEVRRALRRVERQLVDIAVADTETDLRSAGLAADALAAGLLEDEQANLRDRIASLRSVAGAPAQLSGPGRTATAQLDRLRARRRPVSSELRRNREQRAALHTLRSDRDAFVFEVGEQVGRLRALNLLGEVDSRTVCPLCGQDIANQTTHTAELRDRIHALEDELEGARALEPSRRDEVSRLMHEGRGLRIQLDEIDTAIAELEAGLRLQSDRTVSEQRAYVIGRITEFLAWHKSREPAQQAALMEQQRRLKAEADLLEQVIERAAVAAAVESRLTFVERDMSEWARELRLGESGDGVKLDLVGLSVYAAAKDGPIPLSQIGSAENWVGYHLVTHLALHKWFVEQARPVPNFLILDQPEQAYFPADGLLDARDPLRSFPDHDLEKVKGLYEFIHRRVESLEGGLQVLVLGHWNPSSVEWFADARVDNFRDGEALVPSSWLGGQREALRSVPLTPA